MIRLRLFLCWYHLEPYAHLTVNNTVVMLIQSSVVDKHIVQLCFHSLQEEIVNTHLILVF